MSKMPDDHREAVEGRHHSLTSLEIGALSPRVPRPPVPLHDAVHTSEGATRVVPQQPTDHPEQKPTATPRDREDRMHITELEALMEYELAEAVQRHHPLDWKEDAITHDVLIRWRRSFQQTELDGLRYPLQLQWEAYKLHGRRETTYGDIGVLVRYRLTSGTDIEGAGFLEAKARARDSHRFHQINHEQISRLLSNSTHARLLLYDYHPVPVLDDLDGYSPDWELHPHRFYRRRVGQARVTHGATVPLELAAALNQFDDSLYRFAHSLVHQFTRRFFQLHDLDFTDAAVQAVKGFPSTLGAFNVILVIRAAVLGQDLPEAFVPNDNLYGRLENA